MANKRVSRPLLKPWIQLHRWRGRKCCGYAGHPILIGSSRKCHPKTIDDVRGKSARHLISEDRRSNRHCSFVPSADSFDRSCGPTVGKPATVFHAGTCCVSRAQSCSNPYTSGKMKIAASNPISGTIAASRVAFAWPIDAKRHGNKKIDTKEGSLTNM